jgi:hypothetical protein
MPVTYNVVGAPLPSWWSAPQRIRDLFRLRRIIATLHAGFDEIRFFRDEQYRDAIVTEVATDLLRRRLIGALNSRFTNSPRIGMSTLTPCSTPDKRMWRLQVREKLTKRQQTELRLALYWLDGLPVNQKEALVRGEGLRIKVVDAVIGVIQLAAPHVPLDAEAEPNAPLSMNDAHDDTLASTVVPHPRSATATQAN